MTDLCQLDRFDATFQPQRTDDLREGVAEWIGRRLTWEASWLIEEEDSTKFVGQWACTPIAPRPLPPFVWTPSGDLTDIELWTPVLSTDTTSVDDWMVHPISAIYDRDGDGRCRLRTIERQRPPSQ